MNPHELCTIFSLLIIRTLLGADVSHVLAMQDWPERYSYAVSLLDDLTDVADWEGLLAWKRHSSNIGLDARKLGSCPPRSYYHAVLQRCRQIFQRTTEPLPRSPARFSRRSYDPETCGLSAESIYEEPKREIQPQLYSIPPGAVSPSIPHHIMPQGSAPHLSHGSDISVFSPSDNMPTHGMRWRAPSSTSMHLIPLVEAQSRPDIVRRFVGY